MLDIAFSISILIVSIIIYLLREEFLESLSNEILIIILSIILFLYFVLKMLQVKKKNTIIIVSPLYCYIYLIIIFYIFPIIYFNFYESTYYYGLDIKSYSVYIYSIFIAGFSCFVLGYVFVEKIKFNLLRSFNINVFNQTNLSKLFVLSFVLSWINRIFLLSQGIYLQSGDPSSLDKVLFSLTSGFTLLIYLSIGISYYKAYIENRLLWKWIFTITICLEYIYVFPQGSKGNIMLPLITIFLTKLLLNKDQVKIKLSKVVAGGIILLIIYYVISPYTRIYRELCIDYGVGITEKPNVNNVLLLLGRAFNEYVNRGFEIFIEEEQVSKTVSRVSYPEVLYNIIKYFEYGGEVLGGRGYAVVLIGWVPRIIWRSKPEISLGNFYYRLIFNDTGYTSYAITQIGELFINFGFVGVLFGMFMWGGFYAFIWRIFLANLHINTFVFLYILFFHSAIILGTGDNFAGFFIGLIKLFLIISVLLLFSINKK